MKNTVAQITQPQATPPQPIPTQAVFTAELLLTFCAGILTVLGIPQLVKAFATERVKSLETERRREDKVYDSMFTSLENMLKGMNDSNRQMAAGQSSAASESFQLMATLIQEISLIREVVTNNTEVMRKVGDTSEALTQEIHEMRVSGIELKEEVLNLRREVNDITKKY